MNLRHLEVFYAVMKTGTVSAAARRLNVSQPSVSSIMKHAEESLGVALFDRVSGRLRPTDHAHTLLPEVEEIFEKMGLVGQMVRDMKSGSQREIIVAGSPTLANTLLPRAVAKLRVIRPNINVLIESLATYLIVDRIERREVDIGLVYGPNMDIPARVERLASSKIMCAIPVGHLLADEPAITAEDLLRQTVISLAPTSLIGRCIKKACQEARVPSPTPNLQAGSAFSACLMVAEGAGVALVDQTTFMKDFFPGVVIRPFAPPASIDISLVFPLNRRLPPPVSDLANILRQLAIASTSDRPEDM